MTWPTDYLNNVICGDCLEVMKGIPDKSVDLVLTDPPYFLPINSYVGTREKGYEKRTLADTSVLSGYFKLFFCELDRVLKNDGTAYVFCDAQSYPIFYRESFEFFKNTRMLVWDKIVSYNGYTWRHQHELILWGERGAAVRVPTGDGDILRCRGVLQENRNHPAEKPVELLESLISKHNAAIVLDSYCGSGTTGVAAKLLGRQFIGIEISEKYCEIARKRIDGTLVNRNLQFEARP